jgi:hypothetical protein
MFISKKRYKELEKRVAGLERRVQSQQEIIKQHIETDSEFNQKILELSNIALTHTNFCKS